jgi:hypothetical protein
MKLFLCLLILAAIVPSRGHTIEKSEEITLEWLACQESENHAVCLEKIFEMLKPRNILEFGLSYATKYCLDVCKRVISVEVITHGYGPGHLQKFISLYHGYSNWVPIAYFSGYRGDMSWAPYKYIASDAVYMAGSYQCSTHKSYRLIDPFYLSEMGEFISNLIKFNKIETALIHPMLFLRGDLVELCFHKVPVIIAHHTAARRDEEREEGDPFGYRRVKTPPEYEEIYIAKEPGTTVWISKKPEFQTLTDELMQLSTLSP